MLDDLITDIESNKKSSPVVTEFKVAKTIILNATHYFIMRILNKRELQSNH